jgi:hypothetical protein
MDPDFSKPGYVLMTDIPKIERHAAPIGLSAVVLPDIVIPPEPEIEGRIGLVSNGQTSLPKPASSPLQKHSEWDDYQGVPFHLFAITYEEAKALRASLDEAIEKWETKHFIDDESL